MSTLHFTLGPVQGFVARARRTRDLYAGSFLLSYLAGRAMYAVIRAGGKIVFPAVYDGKGEISDPLLKAIMTVVEEKKTLDLGPEVGTLPNRFKAEIPDGFAPDLCRQAVIAAWQHIAGVVWEKFVGGVADRGKGVKEIWKRQVEGFWEINWAVGDENNLLDRRKNWRSHVPAEEPGDKCTVMGSLQELSGFIRATERKKQDAYWRALRQNLPGLELRDDERLCAVSLIKRLYPLVAEDAVGWKLPQHYPSTSYMAAVHWLARTIEQKPDWAEKFAGRAKGCGSGAGGTDRECGAAGIKCIVEAVDKHPRAAGLARLDGNCFYDATLENDRLWPENTVGCRKELRGLLKECKEKPAPFYALLLMDGDQLGVLLRENDEAQVSRALAKFSEQVKDIVEAHNGITVYAGGDDVLALLPLEDALAAAVGLRQSYKKVFKNAHIERATISGAIIYAHHHAPLKPVLLKLHNLLDKVAKDKTGRDSLAVCVWKGAGPVLTWSAPWEVLLEDPDNPKVGAAQNGGRSNLIDELVDAFAAEEGKTREYNSTFFYNLRSLFETLSKDEDNGQLLESIDLVDLLMAEYLKNRDREKSGVTVEAAKESMQRLVRLCRRSRRKNGQLQVAKRALFIDGALLVRFLATKGVRE